MITFEQKHISADCSFQKTAVDECYLQKCTLYLADKDRLARQAAAAHRSIRRHTAAGRSCLLDNILRHHKNHPEMLTLASAGRQHQNRTVPALAATEQMRPYNTVPVAS